MILFNVSLCLVKSRFVQRAQVGSEPFNHTDLKGELCSGRVRKRERESESERGEGEREENEQISRKCVDIHNETKRENKESSNKTGNAQGRYSAPPALSVPLRGRRG